MFLTPVLILTSCTGNKSSLEEISKVEIDLDSIRSRGRLIAVTDFNSTNYFVYRGEPMGFHFELLKSFAEYLDVDLEILTENDLAESFRLLNSGVADILASGLTVNAERKEMVLFSDPLYTTRQVLIQRKPRNWRSFTADEIDRMLIRSQLDLAGKTIYVQSGSAHANRLRSLAAEIGDSITVIEVPYDPEILIQNVARGEIDYTVSDENVAMVNLGYFPDIDINTPVSFGQNIAWALRKEHSQELLYHLNQWLVSFRDTRDYALLYAKYYKNVRSGTIVKSDYYSLSTGRISRWDELLKKAGEETGWDWKLLASLVYQESRFDPKAVSGVGAYGLMQIMPATAEHFGIDVTVSPSENIRAGIKYIKWLHTVFDIKIPDSQERIKFILASYNAGPGHVLDAMNLAAKNGADPLVWDEVSQWLLNKSKPEYYTDPVVKNGYFKGVESVRFVSEVLDRYEHYRNLVAPVPVNHLSLVVK